VVLCCLVLSGLFGLAHGSRVITKVLNASQTSSGGSLWTATNRLQSDLTSISCPVSGECEAVGNGGSTYTSVDGGKNFSSTWFGEFTNLSGVSCPSLNQCVAVSTSGATGYMQNGILGINGAQSWVVGSVPSQISRLSDVSCATNFQCIAVGGTTNWDGTTSAAIIATTDGGATWFDEQTPGLWGDLYSVSCSTASLCVAVGFGGSGQIILITTDAGVASNGQSGWMQVLNPGAGTEYTSVSCPTVNFCAAVGNNQSSPIAAYSINGGFNWTNVGIPNGVTQMQNISCNTFGECLAVGLDGSLLNSLNWGQSWSSQAISSDNEEMTSVDLPPNTSQGITVTVNGVVLTSIQFPGPIVTGVTPAIAVNSTGYSATVTGYGFSSNDTVAISGYQITPTAVTPNSLTIAVPINLNGKFDVQVSSPTLTSPIVASDQITVIPPNTPVATNPVSTYDSADPDVINVSGTYYRFNTNSLGNIPTWKSTDLSSWTYVGDALPTLPSWTNNAGGTVWAPSVIHVANQYDLYYVTKDLSSSAQCISVATSSSPSGPYVDNSNGPLICPNQSSQVWSIDPSGFVDTNGNVYLIWKYQANGSTIESTLMSSNGTSVAGTNVPLIVQSQGWEATVENPDLEFMNGSYYLFYSGGLWNSAQYGVGVAVCSGPLGPCIKPFDYPIVSSYGSIWGPGGETVFKDNYGYWWMGVAAWTSPYTSYSGGGKRYFDLISLNSVFGMEQALGPITGVLPASYFPTISGLSQYTGYYKGTYTLTAYGKGFSTTSAAYLGSIQVPYTIISDTEIQLTVSNVNTFWWVPVVIVSSNGWSTYDRSLLLQSPYPRLNDIGIIFTMANEYVPVTPTRICDTRSSATIPPNYAGDTLDSGQTLNVQVESASGIVPSEATAVVLNLTAVSPSENGYLTAYPYGIDQPATSSLNFSAGAYAVANMVVVPIGAEGKISIYNFQGLTDILADVEGYYVYESFMPPSTGTYYPVSPTRVVDTRKGATDPSTYAGTTLAGGTQESFTVTGVGPIPSSGVGAVVMNLTATNTSSDGFLTAYPTGGTLPTTSSLNFGPNQSVPNRVIVPVNSSGQVTVYANVATDFIVDVSGWFSTSGTGVNGSYFYVADPTRIADSRASSGYQDAGLTLSGASTIGLGTPDTVATVNQFGDQVPSGSVALFANLTATNTKYPGFMTAWPSNLSAPGTSDLNWSPLETIANAGIIPLASNGDFSIAANSTADFVADVSGYFGPLV
ncbi:MAG: family 43 glycosylhydrolase, partial [Acidimicrobiales bacterium]|nr:family 43 glycosylhydrolase [Acidimicrobiales bacterium]